MPAPRAWALLDEAARRVLLVATFFRASASAEALRSSADVQGFAFDRAVERLVDLALLDVQQVDLNGQPRYVLHPLVRAFAGAKLTEQAGFEAGARERWVTWYTSLTAQQDLWTNLSWISPLDKEAETALDVLRWTFSQQQYANLLELSRMVGFYYSIRGEWNILMEIRHFELDAAHAVANREREICALCDLIENYGLQADFSKAQTYIDRIEVIQGSANLSVREEVTIQQHVAMYLIQGQRFIQAQQLLASDLAQEADLWLYMQSWNKYLHALCLYRLGRAVAAYPIFIEALQEAQKVNYAHV